jgi:PAS domain S-box-containing protein
VSANLALIDTLPTSTPTLTDGDAADHLRRLLDRQPACLVRVGSDGTLHAVNDAALHLLGADDLKQVLGTNLADRIAPEHHELWRDFAIRVWTEASGSTECDMFDRSGERRSVQLKGVALPDHPDGLRSLLVNLRDTSAARRLEQALQEHDATRQKAEDLRVQLDEMRATLVQRDAELQRVVAERLVEREKLSAFANEKQLALQQVERESQRALLALRSELERSLADGRRLEEAVAQQTADRRQLNAALKQKEADRQLLEKRLESEIDGSATVRQQAASAIEEARAAQHQAEVAVEEAQAEHETLQTIVKQRDTARQKMLAEYATARIQAERGLTEATARNEQLASALAAQSVELQATAKHLESLAQRFITPERTE